MRIQTLTEKINEQADNDLGIQLRKDFEPVFARFRQFGPITVTHNGVSVNALSIIEALRSKAQELHQPANRESAIHKFVAKVEALTVEMDDLKNSLPQ